MAKQPGRKRSVGRRQPPPHRQEVNPVQPNTRERWDLFNVGVGAYTLPLNVERLFEDGARLGRDPIHSELAPDVFLEADSLRESAHRLAPNARIAEQYDVALDRVLAGPPPTARGTERRVREELGRATAAVVGYCNPRLPWFALGTALGRWRREMVAHLHQVVTDNAQRLVRQPQPTDTDLMRGYTSPPFAPIFQRAAEIPADDANGVNPVRRLTNSWRKDQNATECRRVVREYAPGAAFDRAPWELDFEAVNELEIALYLSLECAVTGRRPVPRWDAATCALLYQGRVIRRYAARAHGVIAVLNLFAAQEWAERVPLPQQLVSNLHDLVKSLNNDLGEIRFRADGTGRGIAWAPIT
jgi:hypothetical protein